MQDRTHQLQRMPKLKSDPIVIRVERGETFYRPGRGGSHRSFRTDYACVGPDGRRFTNTSKIELQRVLRRAYGPVTLEIFDGPTWRSRP